MIFFLKNKIFKHIKKIFYELKSFMLLGNALAVKKFFQIAMPKN
jgi:hypothetical protein